MGRGETEAQKPEVRAERLTRVDSQNPPGRIHCTAVTAVELLCFATTSFISLRLYCMNMFELLVIHMKDMCSNNCSDCVISSRHGQLVANLSCSGFC